MKNNKLFMTVAVTVFFIISMVIGVQTVSAQTDDGLGSEPTTTASDATCNFRGSANSTTAVRGHGNLTDADYGPYTLKVTLTSPLPVKRMEYWDAATRSVRWTDHKKGHFEGRGRNRRYVEGPPIVICPGVVVRFNPHDLTKAVVEGCLNPFETYSPFTPPPPAVRPGAIIVVKEAITFDGQMMRDVPPFTYTLNTGQTATNDSTGRAVFPNLPPGTYTVTETVHAGWKLVRVTPADATVVVTSGGSVVVNYKNQQAQPEVTKPTTTTTPPTVPMCDAPFDKLSIEGAKQLGMTVVGTVCTVPPEAAKRGFVLCENHGGWWNILDVGAGAASGAGTGRLAQGKWGWASAVGAGAGGLVGLKTGPCIGAAVGVGAGSTGFFDRNKKGKKTDTGGNGGTRTTSGGNTCRNRRCL